MMTEFKPFCGNFYANLEFVHCTLQVLCNFYANLEFVHCTLQVLCKRIYIDVGEHMVYWFSVQSFITNLVDNYLDVGALIFS